jgi:hypothetical protein
MMYNLNDNFLLWLPSVILEQMPPKIPKGIITTSVASNSDPPIPLHNVVMVLSGTLTGGLYSDTSLSVPASSSCSSQ